MVKVKQKKSTITIGLIIIAIALFSFYKGLREILNISETSFKGFIFFPILHFVKRGLMLLIKDSDFDNFVVFMLNTLEDILFSWLIIGAISIKLNKLDDIPFSILLGVSIILSFCFNYFESKDKLTIDNPFKK